MAIRHLTSASLGGERRRATDRAQLAALVGRGVLADFSGDPNVVETG
jgi:hypothetical protein